MLAMKDVSYSIVLYVKNKRKSVAGVERKERILLLTMIPLSFPSISIISKGLSTDFVQLKRRGMQSYQIFSNL